MVPEAAAMAPYPYSEQCSEYLLTFRVERHRIVVRSIERCSER
jgi:hypothetical protein